MEWDFVSLILRWLHILAALVAAGGTFFIRWALLPSLEVLPDDARRDLHERIRRRWAPFVHGAIVVLLATGIVNFINGLHLFEKAGLKGTPVSFAYNLLFGIKFLLALVVFFIASALLGRSEAFAKIRAQRRMWLTVNAALIVVIVCLSGMLRSTHNSPAPPAASAPAISK